MSHFAPPWSWLLAAGGLSCLATVALARPPADEDNQRFKVPPTRFVRLRLDADKQPLALETAIVRYVPPAGKGNWSVDLVSVVHIADREYYQQLNRKLAGYDVVLYELVAPPGTRIPKGGRRDPQNLLSLVQTLLKTVLGLELQTEQIDYTQPHFVHADLSPQQLWEAMQRRGETGLTLVLGLAADLLRQYQRQQQSEAGRDSDEELDPLSLLLDPEAPLKLKRLMARQLASVGEEEGLGQTLNRLLIVERNKAALRVLEKELAKGRRRIAIFYGAGHMPDFERRLVLQFGLQRQSVEWLRAWDLRATPDPLGGLFRRPLP